MAPISCLYKAIEHSIFELSYNCLQLSHKVDIMVSVRSCRVVLWVLSLVTVAHASCDIRNQVSSWENTTFIDAGFNSPSAPFICQRLWNSTEVEPLESVRGHYDITRFDLEAWNCFLSSADGPSTPHVAYCVDAVLEPTDIPPPPPPPPPFTQPVQTLVPVESQSVATLYPRQEEEVPTFSELGNTTVQPTPQPSLTTLYGVTFNNTAFSGHTMNSSSTMASGDSSAYDFDTWSTVTIPRDVEPTAVDLGLGKDETLQIGNIMEEQNGSDIALRLPHFNGRIPSYELACDAPGTDEKVPEICQLTRYCTGEAELPVCENGDCRCKPVFCSKQSECEEQDLCRSMDQTPFCEFGTKPSAENDKEGTYTCRPKYTHCSGNGDHGFCAEKFNCTGWSYDVFRFPLCQPFNASRPWGSSWCECKETECTYGNWQNTTNFYGGDASVCVGFPCPSDSGLYGDEPACAWDPSSSLNGTCDCKYSKKCREG